MRAVKHHDFSRLLSFHLEPEEALHNSVNVEFSVQQVPSMPDPKVSCYRSNGCIVFEGYCPIDSQIPFRQCGVRNTVGGSTRQEDIDEAQNSGETEAPYNPFVLWDVIPRLMHDIIYGTGWKVRTMDDKKLSPSGKNLPVNNTLHDDPAKPSGSYTVFDSVRHWDGVPNENQMAELRTPGREHDTPIFPLITGLENSGDSSDELSIADDPFRKLEMQTVGNVVDQNTPGIVPVFLDNMVTKSSEALEDAADLITQRNWRRREAHPGSLKPAALPERRAPRSSIAPAGKRVSTVLSTYIKSVPLQKRPEPEPNKKNADGFSVSISETDSGDIEVGLSETDSSGSSGEAISYVDVACGTDRIDREASRCILCGFPLRDRQRRHESAPTAGYSSRIMMDAPTTNQTTEPRRKANGKTRIKFTAHPVANTRGHSSRAMMDATVYKPNTEHRQKPKDKRIREEVFAYPVTTIRGQPPRNTMDMSIQATSAGLTQHSKEKARKQEVTPYSVASKQGHQSRPTMFAPTDVSTAEPKQHSKQKHARQETLVYSVNTSASKPLRMSRAVGTSTLEEREEPEKNRTENSNKFVNNNNVAVYTMSQASGSVFRPSVKANQGNDKTQCTMKHVVLPRDICPYAPSLASLPLDESDIEYIIRRAQLAKATLPAEESACPTERWQHRSHHRQSTSGRSRSTG